MSFNGDTGEEGALQNSAYRPILAQAAINFPHCFRGWKSEVRVTVPLGSGESALEMGTLLLCWHKAEGVSV